MSARARAAVAESDANPPPLEPSPEAIAAIKSLDQEIKS